jgi:ubiquinone/menaquinone biosynthesis C-methylase UbiE
MTERAMPGGPRPNSFNLAPHRDVTREQHEACPLAKQPERITELTEQLSSARFALLRFKDRMRLFFANTGDFGDEEIARTKATGQLYMDVSGKLMPDDFSADLRKLALEPECRRCPELVRCPGCFGAHAVDVFVRDETRVRAIVRQLDGDVLDVGAGHAPYASMLGPAVETGRARYLALDPDAARLEVVRSRYAWADVRLGTLDDLAGEAPRFRHVLILRSYNHLPDRDAALARVYELLEPGGTVLIVDDVAFGLLRAREHVARAESGPATFEHYANESAAEAEERAKRVGFETLERHDVSDQGSNQWFLRCKKPAR